MMDGKDQLREATPDELNQMLAFALSFDGRKEVHLANEFMSNHGKSAHRAREQERFCDDEEAAARGALDHSKPNLHLKD